MSLFDGSDVKSQALRTAARLRRVCAERRVEELEVELAARTEADPDLVRRQVLEHQALRARLAKRDMSPLARLRTLRAAAEAKLPLNDEQLDELEDLEFDLWDVASPR